MMLNRKSKTKSESQTPQEKPTDHKTKSLDPTNQDKPTTTPSDPVKPDNSQSEVTTKPEELTTGESGETTLTDALEEEGEGRTVDNLTSPKTRITKVQQARGIMLEMWDDIQSGKVKRRDVVKRFVDEVHLTKAGASTYYGNLKTQITNDVENR